MNTKQRKSEYRNPKFETNGNPAKQKPPRLSCFIDCRFALVMFVSDFEIRISDLSE